MIDGVLFDLDGTICDYRRPGDEILATAFGRAGVEPLFSMGDYLGAFEDHAPPGEPIDVQREACFAALAAEAGGAPGVGRSVARVYAEERDHSEVDPLPGALEAIEHLAEDHRIGMVTNGPPDMQATKLAALGLDDAFETVVHAGHDAPPKPDPEPFYLALDALAVEPGRALHVGNSLEADVAGARAAGLRTAWLPETPDADSGDHAPDYVLSSLADLAEPPWR
jgi:putative hydrolase of the HAD superfamily